MVGQSVGFALKDNKLQPALYHPSMPTIVT